MKKGYFAGITGKIALYFLIAKQFYVERVFCVCAEHTHKTPAF